MAIKSEKIEGKKIINEVESSNVKKTIYDTETKSLQVIFNNGAEYIYEDVPHSSYTKFRMAESQGKYFSAEIAKKHKYKKVTK